MLDGEASQITQIGSGPSGTIGFKIGAAIAISLMGKKQESSVGVVKIGNPDVSCEFRTSRILTDPLVVSSCLRPSGLMGGVFCLVLGWQTQLSSLNTY